MRNKKVYFISILLIVSLFCLTGCTINKNVRNKEVKKFEKSVTKNNKKIKDLYFYLHRRILIAEIVYDGDINKEEQDTLVRNFKNLINIEFMEEIGNRYQRGVKPREFSLYIYVDHKKELNDYDYVISSYYNKTYVVNEEIENIDGYETWTITDKKDNTRVFE